ncbi:MAG: hypothetical protein V1676_07115 [Candidatus Diapherotrites archaeon]
MPILKPPLQSPYRHGCRVYSSQEAYADALRFFGNEFSANYSKIAAEQPKLAPQLWELEHMLPEEREEEIARLKARGVELPEGYKFGEFAHLGKVVGE